jgi:hypothetical protein
LTSRKKDKNGEESKIENKKIVYQKNFIIKKGALILKDIPRTFPHLN